MSGGASPGLMMRLAARDMARETLHVLCITALIAGVVAPLMLLFAIRDGVMDSLVGRLRENPEMRRIAIIGDHLFDPARAAEIAGWPEVAFAAPQERGIARRMQMRPPGARAFERVTLIGSGPGEPLLPPGVALEADEVAVSAGLAAKFGLEPGAVLDAHGLRGDPPDARFGARLRVAHIVPRGWLAGSAALAPPAFLDALEAFYDGHALPAYGAPDGPPLSAREPAAESFRVYAADIRDVAALEARLERALGVQTRSRVAEIAPLLGLDRDIGAALRVLAVCAVAGLAAALTALFWSNVERKRMALATLALLGAPPRLLALFPLAQAGLYALAGWATALVLALAGSAALQALFADDVAARGGIAPVSLSAALWLLAGLLALALVAGGLAARRALRVDPALAIRQGG